MSVSCCNISSNGVSAPSHACPDEPFSPKSSLQAVEKAVDDIFSRFQSKIPSPVSGATFQPEISSPSSPLLPTGGLYDTVVPSFLNEQALSVEQKKRRELFLARPLCTAFNQKVPDYKLQSRGVDRRELTTHSLIREGVSVGDFLEIFRTKLQSYFKGDYEAVVKGARIYGSGASACIVPWRSVKALSDADISFYFDHRGTIAESNDFMFELENLVLEAYYDVIDKTMLPEQFRNDDMKYTSQRLLKEAYLTSYVRPFPTRVDNFMIIGIGDLDLRMTLRIGQEVDCSAASYQIDLYDDHFYCLDSNPEEAMRHYRENRFVCRTPERIDLKRVLLRMTKKDTLYNPRDLIPFLCNQIDPSIERVLIHHCNHNKDNERAFLAVMNALIALRQYHHNEEDKLFCAVIASVHGMLYDKEHDASAYSILESFLSLSWYYAAAALLKVMQDRMMFISEERLAPQKRLYIDALRKIIATEDPRLISQVLPLLSCSHEEVNGISSADVIPLVRKACDSIVRHAIHYDQIDILAKVVAECDQRHSIFVEERSLAAGKKKGTQKGMTRESFYSSVVLKLVQKAVPTNVTHAHDIIICHLSRASPVTKNSLLCEVVCAALSCGMHGEAEKFFNELCDMEGFSHQDGSAQKRRTWSRMCETLLASKEDFVQDRGRDLSMRAKKSPLFKSSAKELVTIENHIRQIEICRSSDQGFILRTMVKPGMDEATIMYALERLTSLPFSKNDEDVAMMKKLVLSSADAMEALGTQLVEHFVIVARTSNSDVLGESGAAIDGYDVVSKGLERGLSVDLDIIFSLATVLNGMSTSKKKRIVRQQRIENLIALSFTCGYYDRGDCETKRAWLKFCAASMGEWAKYGTEQLFFKAYAFFEQKREMFLPQERTAFSCDLYEAAITVALRTDKSFFQQAHDIFMRELCDEKFKSDGCKAIWRDRIMALIASPQMLSKHILCTLEHMILLDKESIFHHLIMDHGDTLRDFIHTSFQAKECVTNRESMRRYCVLLDEVGKACAFEIVGESDSYYNTCIDVLVGIVRTVIDKPRCSHELLASLFQELQSSSMWKNSAAAERKDELFYDVLCELAKKMKQSVALIDIIRSECDLCGRRLRAEGLCSAAISEKKSHATYAALTTLMANISTQEELDVYKEVFCGIGCDVLGSPEDIILLCKATVDMFLRSFNGLTADLSGIASEKEEKNLAEVALLLMESWIILENRIASDNRAQFIHGEEGMSIALERYDESYEERDEYHLHCSYYERMRISNDLLRSLKHFFYDTKDEQERLRRIQVFHQLTHTKSEYSGMTFEQLLSSAYSGVQLCVIVRGEKYVSLIELSPIKIFLDVTLASGVPIDLSIIEGSCFASDYRQNCHRLYNAT